MSNKALVEPTVEDKAADEEYYNLLDIPQDVRQSYFVIGNKLTEARTLSGLKRHQAAPMLGIDHETLRLMERGYDCDNYIEQLTPAFILEAAKLYSVTTDFLFGLADDEFEREREAIIIRRSKVLMLRCELMQNKYIEKLLKRYDRRITAAADAIDEMLDAVANINATFFTLS